MVLRAGLPGRKDGSNPPDGVAERLHGDDTTVPVLAKGKTATGRIWTYVRDDRPFAGPAPPAALFFARPTGRANIPGSILPVMAASCRPMPMAAMPGSMMLTASPAR